MVHWCTQSETIRNRIVPTKVFEKYSLTGFLKHDYLFSITLSESQKPAFDLSPNVVCFSANFEISWYSWARERPAHWQPSRSLPPDRAASVALWRCSQSKSKSIFDNSIYCSVQYIDYPTSYSKLIIS